MADYLYLVQLEVPADLEDDFNRIYDTQHVPNILKAPGVHGCSRYRLHSANVEGVARYAAMYEIDSPEVPQSAAWKAESDKGDWVEKIRPFLTYRSHITFKKIN